MKSGSVSSGAGRSYSSGDDKLKLSTSKMKGASQMQRAAAGPAAHTPSLLDQIKNDPEVANSFPKRLCGSLAPRRTTLSFGGSAPGPHSKLLVPQSASTLAPGGAVESDLAKYLHHAIDEHEQKLLVDSLIKSGNLGQHVVSSSSPVQPSFAAADELRLAGTLKSAQSMQDNLAENDWVSLGRLKFQSDAMALSSLQKADALENLRNAIVQNDFNASLKSVNEFLLSP